MKIATATIDINALKHNVKVLKNLAPKSKILAIVKANAYGHGIVQVSTYLSNDVDGFGVARIEEARTLREEGVLNDIVVLGGFTSASDLLLISDLNISTVVHNLKQVELIKSLCSNLNGLKIWLKFNTGMNRLGMNYEDFMIAYEQLKNLSCVKSILLMSHFSCADEKDHPETKIQIEKFKKLSNNLNIDISFCNSGGILYNQEVHGNWIRPGILLYGISPNEQPASSFGFKEAMTLETLLISTKKINLGDSVGYAKTWESKKETIIGVIAIGYGDGYPRLAPEGTPVLINGRKVPIVGRVSMDLITVDLGIDSTDQIGDKVTLFGPELTIEEVSSFISGYINYDITTGLTARVKQIYKL